MRPVWVKSPALPEAMAAEAARVLRRRRQLLAVLRNCPHLPLDPRAKLSLRMLRVVIVTPVVAVTAAVRVIPQTVTLTQTTRPMITAAPSQARRSPRHRRLISLSPPNPR